MADEPEIGTVWIGGFGFPVQINPEQEPDKVTIIDPNAVLVGEEAEAFIEGMLGAYQPSDEFDYGPEFDDGRYDDDPNPYHGTYAEE